MSTACDGQMHIRVFEWPSFQRRLTGLLRPGHWLPRYCKDFTLVVNKTGYLGKIFVNLLPKFYLYFASNNKRYNKAEESYIDSVSRG